MGGRAEGRGTAAGRGIVGPLLTRRSWLGSGAVALVTGLATSLSARSTKGPPLTADEERAVEAVREKAKKVGLGTLEVRWTEHFLGVGDAPAEEYIARALGLCESFAREFLAHFRDRGFPIELPPRRMSVVALKDAASYQKFSGDEQNVAVGGHYDLDTNQLVVFDFRPGREGPAKGAKRVNTFTLIHETAHMLSYNTGLLPTGRDIPVAVSEGIATYTELWAPPRDRSAFGRVNQPRLEALGEADWIPISRLLADDKVFDGEKTVDIAYAESWLLVHQLLRQPEWHPRFKAYLAGFPRVGGKVGREAYAASALGSLRELDAEIRRYARRLRTRRR